MFLSTQIFCYAAGTALSQQHGEVDSFHFVVLTSTDQKSGMPLDLDEYSVTSRRNIEDLSSRSRVGVSNSETRPAKIITKVF